MRKKCNHFRPRSGWINDPNGTIYIDGTYHMFYQYYPHDTKWGPMHWGHATSTDLLSFAEEQIAIMPDDKGFIFSGSCILDKNDAAGFMRDGRARLIAMYTNHDPQTSEETQCLAVSEDYSAFEKYEGNPVIKNPGIKDFRDPKLFYNQILGGYSIVLAAGSRVMFYHSTNLLDWDYTGEFDVLNSGFCDVCHFSGEKTNESLVCECPDLICFEDKWVLNISLVQPLSESENDRWMQYFVGDFDGKAFRAASSAITDFGCDDYAMVSFAGIPDDKVFIGWAENWEYVNELPEYICMDVRGDSDFTALPSLSRRSRGRMTLGKKAKLVDTDIGPRLLFFPVHDKPLRMNVPEGRSVTICPGLTITVSRDEIVLDRSESSMARDYLKDKPDYMKVMRAKRCVSEDISAPNNSVCRMLVIIDEDLVEIYADDGLIVFTVRI